MVKNTLELRLSFDDLVLGVDIVVANLNDVFAVGFLFGMGLAELCGDVFDFFCDFEGFIHNIDETGTFCADSESEFDVVFFLFVFVLDKETDGGGLLCENCSKEDQEGKEDM